jgi:poly(glycerol-phosphate) alpha-glucosyltransferase
MLSSRYIAGIGDEKMDKELLNRVEMIFIVDKIVLRQNGINISVMRKMKLIEDEWGVRPLLVTTDYNSDFNWMKDYLSLEGYSESQTFFTKNARVKNVFDFFQKTYTNEDVPAITYKRGQAAAGLRIETDGDIDNFYDARNRLVKFEQYSTLLGCLKRVMKFDAAGRKAKEIFYDDYGYVSMIRVYDEANNDFYPCENYYTTDRKLCIKAEYRYETDEAKQDPIKRNKNKLFKFSLYDDGGFLIKECENETGLLEVYLDKITSDPAKTYLVADETGVYSNATAAQNKWNVVRAAIVHNVFLRDSNNPKSGPQPYFEHVCARRDRFDAIIFLTEQERQDFNKIYRDSRNTFVLPHPYPKEIVRAEFDKRDPRRAVIVARFDVQKRIDLAIDIVKLVAAEVPDVKLELYGFGQEHDKLAEYIRTTGMENNVEIKGFTDNPAEVFSSASLFMMTSSIEGFGLTIMESICNGCPAFAFDIKYGPSDIVKDGVTGFLFPFAYVRDFADKMIAFLKDEGLRRQMSENAYADAPNFSQKFYLERWYAIVEKICKYRR